MFGVILWIFFFHRCFHLLSAYSESSYDFYILEECPLNTLVGIIPLESSTSYRTSTSNSATKNSFSLNQSTGEIRTLQRIDRESIQAFNDTVDLIVVSQTATLISIHIHILDINDNPPVFIQGFNNISIVEGATPGSRFPLQAAKDPDKGENGTVLRYLLKPENPNIPNPFKITRITDADGGDSLFLELLDFLDREKQSSYSFELQVLDGGSPPLTSSSFVFVNVLDVNDNAPSFDEEVKNVSITSIGEQGDIVANISAHDADAGVNSELTYVLLDDLGGQFEIDPSSGVVRRTKKKVICQKESCLLCLPKLCVLSIEAQDQGSPKLTGRTFLNIHLTEENLFTPQISFKIYPVNANYILLESNSEIGATLAVLTVMDEDYGRDGQTEVVLISGNEDGFFHLESGRNFAILRLNKTVDQTTRRQFSLEFEATDFGVPPKKSRKKLTAYVKNNNDKPPKFDRQNYEVTIPEATKIGARISRIRVHSENGEARLKFLNANESLPFSLNSRTGVIKVSGYLDFDLQSRYYLEVEASDPIYHWLRSTSKVVIQLSDSNNHSPQLMEERPLIFISEDTNLQEPIYRAKCLDLDYAENGAVFYQLTEASFPLVRVDQRKGNVFLTQELDYEKVKNFTFQLTCIDDGIPSRMNSTKISVFVQDTNDNSPFFDVQSLEVNARQNDAVGTHLITVRAQDLDELDKNSLNYFILESSAEVVDIDEKTGVLFTTNSLESHKSGSSFKVKIGATDGAGHSSSNNVVITIHVIDELTEIPVFLENKWTLEIEENSPVNRLVGNFRATVSHKGSIEYDLLRGSQALSINKTTGEVRTKVIFDYEKEQKIDFTVIAKTEKSVASSDGTIFVTDVNDNKPKFIGKKEFIVDLARLPIGSVFGKVEVVDIDSGNNGRLTYSSRSDLIGIGKMTGLLWVQPRNTEIKEHQWQVTIEAVDNGVPKMSSSASIIIKLLNNPAPFEFHKRSQVSFSKEVSLTPKNASRYYYSCSVDGLDDFLPDGEIFFDAIQYQPVQFIPYEVEDTELNRVYSSELEIIQPTPKSSGFKCSMDKFRVKENSPVGSRLSASLLTNEIGNYRFKLLNELDKFFIDPWLGSISTSTILDAEKEREYKLKLQIIDLKTQSSPILCDIVVEVIDENDNLPTFEKLYYSKSIVSYFTGNILNVTATDLDIQGPNNKVIYSLPKNERKFSIDQHTGTLKTTKPLKPLTFHNITVYARNPDSNDYSKTFVLIRVEADPHVKPIIYVSQDVTVSESTKLGSVIAAVSAHAMESSVHFDIIDGNLLSTFEIDPYYGEIILARPLDFERIQIFNLTIIAKTKFANSTAKIRINVQNEKDNPPTIKSMKFYIQENQKPGTTVGKVTIEDPENRPLDEIDVEILYQIPADGKFYLNADNEIVAGASLDREETESYRVLIKATDKKMKNSSSESEITINIQDENDNLPECQDLGAFMIPKDINYPLRLEVSCHDRDQGYNASVGYKLKEETEDFKLEWSGILWVMKEIKKPLTTISIMALDRMSMDTKSEDDGLRSSTTFREILVLENPGKIFSQARSSFILQRTSSVGTVIGKLPLLNSTKSAEFFIINSGVSGLISLDRESSELRVIKAADENTTLFYLDIVGIDTMTQKTEIHKIKIEISDDDVNGHFLVPKMYEFEFNESIAEGKSVGRIQVPGARENSLKFQFHNNATEIPFRLDANSGEVFVLREVDFETTKFYTTEVIISSKAIATTVPVYFHISDVNDNPPVFTETSFDFFIREDSSIGEFVGQFQAYDIDSGIYGRVRYQLIDAPDSLFLLDTVSGILTLGGKLDHEIRAFYKFEVRAYDIDGKDNRATVMVFVEDVNDNPPYFLEEKTTVANVLENSPIGTIVYQLKYSDSDTANDFNFEIDPSTNGFGHFGIDNMGSISVKNFLDRELISEYKLKIILKDSFPPFDVHSAEITVTIVVDDVNDNAPLLRNLTFIVSEQAPVGTIVGPLAAIDPDNDFIGLNSLIQYRIDPNSNPKAVFVVDPLLGYLIVNKPLDRETVEKYRLLIIAEDSGTPRLRSTQWVEVLIQDEDDNPPVLDPDSINQIEIEENIPIGSLVTTIKFTDNDIGGNAAVICEIVNGNPHNLFRIDSFGNLFVSGILDFEEHPEHELNISLRSFSGKHESLFTIITIHVEDKNDEAPYFIDGNRITLKIAENQEIDYPTVIASIKAIDRDMNQTTGTTYSMPSGNSSIFSVDSTSGDLILSSPLDYEDIKEYELIIRATDSADPQLFSSIHVKIQVVDDNDNDPVFSQLYYIVSVGENADIDQILLQVNATDADSGENGQIRYSIENSEYTPFVINYITGEMRAMEKFDYEKQSLYRVLVGATDNGRFIERRGVTEVIVYVLDENDNPPVLDIPNPDVLIRSDTKKGNVVFVINAFDLDTDDHLKFTIEGPDKDFFAVDKRGVIRMRTHLPKQSEFSIVVVAVDTANHSTSLQLNFYVSPGEDFPIFRPTDTRFKIFENQSNYEILKLDALSTKGPHCVRYSIASGDPEGHFSLDPFSGHLKTRNLDYEKIQEHHLYIAATDCLDPSHTSFQPLVIFVKDVNDNQPEFEKALYTVKLTENAEPPREPILHLQASDKDFGSNGIIKYRIIEGNANNAFELDETSGELFQVIQLDREEVDEYKLIVEAKDGGDPSLSQVTMIMVKVIDENDNAPKFSRLLKTSVSENSPVGTFVMQVSATDADTEEFSKNIYSIDGPDSEYFEIDRISGNLTLKKTLDREKKSVHKFKVYAQDGFWKVSASMTIVVEDANDNPPRFLETMYNFTILKKDVAVGKQIGKITATDDDIGRNKEIIYFLAPNITFIQIDPKSGRLSFLTTVKAMDVISFEVGAMDLGAPSNMVMTEVNVFLVDENRSRCCFLVNDNYKFVVSKVEDNISLGGVQIQGECIYYLEGNPDTVKIDRYTGEITGNFSEYKIGEELNFKIRAESVFNSSNFTTSEMTIFITEDDKFDWQLESYNFTIRENSPLNTTIGTVSITAPFATYRISSKQNIPFGIDEFSGRLFVTNLIDFDSQPRFDFCVFEVHTTVPGYPSRIFGTTVNIRILDENDNAPEFETSEKIISVSGSIPVGSVVFTAEAFDADGPHFNEIFYSISKNNNFEIDTKSGDVFSLTNLDFSMSNHYDFTVKAANFNSSLYSFCKIKIELRIPMQNTAVFRKKYEFTEISKRSKISTIVAKMESQSMFGIPYYFIEPLHDKFMMERKGVLELVKKLDTNDSFVITAIVKSGLLKRQPPTTCSIRILTNDLAPAPTFPENKYIINLHHDPAENTELLKFNFVLPSDSAMEVRGDDQKDFCFNSHGALLVCRKLRRKKYHLTLEITSGGKLRSSATLEVTVEGNKKKQLSLVSSNRIATVVENCGEELRLLKLKTYSTKKDIKYWIADNYLTEIFALNSSSGILSLKQSLDRERRSLYSIPIRISDGEYSENSTVHVFIDDEDDNKPVFTPLSFWISSDNPLFSGFIPKIHPVDPDDINTGDCIDQNVNDKITVYSNCSMECVDLPFGKTTHSLKYESGDVYSINLNMLLTNEEIVRQQIIVQLFGTERGVAEFLQKLQGSIPDMLVHITGADHPEENEFKLFISILNPTSEILPAPETLRILNNFYVKKQKFLDVTNYRGYESACSVKNCGNNTCQSVRLLKNSWETFRSVDKLWHVPRVQMFGNCETTLTSENPVMGLEKDCGEFKCIHGHCMENNTCLCDSNYFGDTCSSRIYSFGHNSFLNLSLKKQLSNLSFLVITKEPHGVLLHSRSSTSNSSIMIDYINGKPRITTMGSRGSHSALLQESINDGHWHRISLTAQPTGTFAFVVENCDTTCIACQSNNCHTIVPSVFIDGEIIIGGVSEEEISYFQPSATFLRACLKSITINGEESSGFRESKILSNCPILFPSNYCESSEAQMSCQAGTCESEWDDYKCICATGVESTSCNSDDQTVSLKNGRIRLTLSPFIQHQLRSLHHNSKVIKREDRLFYDDVDRRNVFESSEEYADSQSVQFLEVDVRTIELEAHIFTVKFGSQKASLVVVNGSLHYGLYHNDKPVVNIIAEKFVSDGVWHRIRIEVSSTGTAINLKIDDYGRGIDSPVTFPKFIFKELEFIEFGGYERKPSFFGCLRRLIINGQMQLLYPRTRTLQKQYFWTEIISHASFIQLGCESTLICGNSISDDQEISRCSIVSLDSRTQYTLVAGFCIILVTFSILLALALIHYHKKRKRRRLARNTQRISNLQLVSTIEGSPTYKNWSYDEVENTEMRRYRCGNGHENSAYLSHNSLENNHIYDEAITEQTQEFHPVKQFQKPTVMPRRKTQFSTDQSTSQMPNNSSKSRFFRPGEKFGLFPNPAGSHTRPISLDDFYHEPIEDETGHMSQRV